MQTSSSKASTPQHPTRPRVTPPDTTGPYHTVRWEVDHANRGRFEFRITEDLSYPIWNELLQSVIPNIMRRELGKLDVSKAQANGPNVRADTHTASRNPKMSLITFALYIYTPSLKEYWPVDHLLHTLCDIADWDVLEFHMPDHSLHRDASQDNSWKDYTFPMSTTGSSKHRIVYEGLDKTVPLQFLFAATKKLKSLEEIDLRCSITLSTFVQLCQEAHLPEREWLEWESDQIPIKLRLQGMVPEEPASATPQAFPLSSFFSPPDRYDRIKYVDFGVIAPNIGFSLANVLYVAREGLVFLTMDVTAHPNECFADSILTCAKLTAFVVECREEQMESLRKVCSEEGRGWKVEVRKMNGDDTRLLIAGSVKD